MNMGDAAHPRRIPPSALDLWGDAVCEVLGVDDFEPEDIDGGEPGLRERSLFVEHGPRLVAEHPEMLPAIDEHSPEWRQ
jgi:hypothetical protein